MIPGARLQASRTAAIYGDANAATATVVPTITEAADSQNLTVSADTSVLNKNQILNLDDTFYETITNEVFPQQLADGKLAIAGTTMGWIDTQKCFLEIPVKISYTAGTNLNNQMTTFDGELINYKEVSGWEEWTQPEFNMLRPIQRFSVYLGENNVAVQRAQMNFAQNFPIIIYDRKIHSSDYPMYASVGMPIATGSCFTQNKDANGATRTWGLTQINKEYSQCFSRAWFDRNRRRNLAGISYLTVPLYFLNSFFRENQYLPPGLKFRFEMEYNPGVVEIMRSSVQAQTEGKDLWFCQYQKDVRFNAFAYILRAGTQEQINRTWITQPFLYNYITYEYLERKLNGTSVTYYENIAISQQRPTDLIIRVVNESGDGYLNNAAQNMLFSYKDAGLPGVIIHDIKINIAGRLQYYFRNMDQLGDQKNQWTGGAVNMVDALMQTANKDTWRNLNEEEWLVQPQTRSINQSMYTVISIQPGNMQSIGNYSVDQGAVSIQLEINLSMNDKVRTPIPTGNKLVIYKKLTEQLAIDGNKNVQLIQWPAVKSNSGYVIQQTFNMN